MYVTMLAPMLPEVAALRSLEHTAPELAEDASGLAKRVHDSPVGDLVQSMHCCHSDLIEGHDTHPEDIERALAPRLSSGSRQAVVPPSLSEHAKENVMTTRTAIAPLVR